MSRPPTASDLRLWALARRAAAERERAELRGHPPSPEESFRLALSLIDATAGRLPRDAAVGVGHRLARTPLDLGRPLGVGVLLVERRSRGKRGKQLGGHLGALGGRQPQDFFEQLARAVGHQQKDSVEGGSGQHGTFGLRSYRGLVEAIGRSAMKTAR